MEAAYFSIFRILIMTTGFLLLSLWLRSLIHAGILALLAPKFYSRISSFTLFGYEYENIDGKFVFVKKENNPIIQARPVFDIKKYPNASEEMLDKADSTFALVASGITFAICLALSIGFFFLRTSLGETSFLTLFITSIALGLLWHGAVIFGIAIFSVYKVKTSLAGYVTNARKKVMAGQRFGNLNLKTVEELPYKKVAYYEELMYYPIYMAYLEDSRNESRMNEIAEKTASLLNSHPFNRSYLYAFAQLVYYYSYINRAPEKAKYFYNEIKQYLENDTDANSYRIRAHYELTVNNNYELARSFADKANAKLPVFSAGGERLYEADCIQKLYERLDNEANYII